MWYGEAQIRVLTLFLSVCLYVESDGDWEHAPQGDWGAAGSFQPQWTRSQQALGLWRRGGSCFFFFFPLLMFYSFSPPLITIKLINLCFFRLRDRTSTSKPWRRLNWTTGRSTWSSKLRMGLRSVWWFSSKDASSPALSMRSFGSR